MCTPSSNVANAMPKIQTARLSMWYERFPATAPKKDSAPIILHAGLSMQSIFWPDSLIQTLNDEGFDVVVFDNRDIGQTEHMHGQHAPNTLKLLAARISGRPMDVPYTIADMADDTVALMDALDIPVAHVAGMSMGGMIAQTVAIRHPERVKSLCSWASSTGTITDSLVSPTIAPAMLKPPSTDPEQRIHDGVELFVRIGTKRYPSDVNELYTKIRLAAERAQGDPHGIARQMTAILATPSRRAALKKITVPTLVIHGDKDPLQPLRGGKATARLVPHSELFLIREYGHNLPEELMKPIGKRMAVNARRAAKH